MLCSCAYFNKNSKSADKANFSARASKKVSTSKKVVEAKEKSSSPDVTGKLASGVEYSATPEADGFVVSFDPFIQRNDQVFVSVATQVVAKLYSDKLKNESSISIETDIGYTIFTGEKSRYKIIPFKETSGEISSISVNTISGKE